METLNELQIKLRQLSQDHETYLTHGAAEESYRILREIEEVKKKIRELQRNP